MTTSIRNIEFAVADRGRARRLELGLKVRDVAARLGRTETLVYLLERDGASTLDTIRRWAKALEMKPSALAFGEEG